MFFKRFLMEKKKGANSTSMKGGLQGAQQDKDASQWMERRMSADVSMCKDFRISSQLLA